MKTKLTIYLVLLLSLLLRIYQLPLKLFWGMDEDYWAYLARNAATLYHLSLIGGNMGATGFHTTPWFVYLLAIISRLFYGNPLAFGYVATLLGVLTTLVYFLVGRKIFGMRTGAIAAIMYAVSSLTVFADQRFWNVMLLPLLSVLLFYFAHQFLADKKNALIYIALVIAAFFSAHGLAFVALIFVALVVIVRSLIQKRPVVLKQMFTPIVLVILSISPVIIFESRHGFIETRRFLVNSVAGHTLGATFQISQILNVIGSTLGGVFYYPSVVGLEKLQTVACPSYPQVPIFPFSLVLALGVIIFCAYKMLKKNNRFGLLFLMAALNIIGLLLYPESPKRYYLDFLHPLLFFCSAYLMAKLTSINIVTRLAVFVIVFLFVLVNIQKIAFSNNKYAYARKLALVKEAITLASNNPYALDFKSTDRCQAYGLRYIFTYLGSEPVKSYADPDFLWLYEGRISHASPAKTLTIHLNDRQQFVQVTHTQ